MTPAHPCAGGLTIEDIQRRVAAQIVELKLDERVKEGREVLNKHFSAGRERVGAVLGNVWAEVESMRENQRKKAAAATKSSEDGGRSPSPALRPVTGDLTGRASGEGAESPVGTGVGWANKRPNIDLAQVQANAAIAKEKVGATLSGWWANAAEKKKAWEESRRQQQQQQIQAQRDTNAPGKGTLEGTRPGSGTGPVFGSGVAPATGKQWATGWTRRGTAASGNEVNSVRSSEDRARLSEAGAGGTAGTRDAAAVVPGAETGIGAPLENITSPVKTGLEAESLKASGSNGQGKR